LLSSKFTLGGDDSVAAGPVGRQVGAETDALISAEVLSYSRSKGVFVGLELKGTVISQDTEHMEGVYFIRLITSQKDIIGIMATGTIDISYGEASLLSAYLPAISKK
jgi:lipid-binding SYLF domain-containing protein